MPSNAPSYTEENQYHYFSKTNLLWLVITALVFFTLIRLGLWQSARALEKEQRLAQIEKLSAQKPISLEQVLTISADKNSLSDINDYPVFIEGTFDEKQLFLLDNQVNKGRLGYRAYQVAVTSQYSVLICLGWVQGSIDRKVIPKINALSGPYKFRGNVRLVEEGIVLQEQLFSDVNWPLRIQQIELEKFSSLINSELLPFVIYLDKSEVIGFEKNWQPIVMPPEKHRAYAFQWFSLSLAWLLLMLWAKFGNSDNKKNR